MLVIVTVSPALVVELNAAVTLGVAAADPAVNSPVCKPIVPAVPNVVGAHVTKMSILGQVTRVQEFDHVVPTFLVVICNVVPTEIV